MPTTTAAAPTTRSRTRRTQMCGGIIGALNQEWEATLADRPVPTAWPTTMPALAGLRRLQDILDAISANITKARTDQLLYALLRLHDGGDALAGRVVLQTMLGKVARMARTVYKRGISDSHEVALEAMWSTIRSYPLRRTTSVAGNLALDALRHLDRPDHLELPVDGTGLENLEQTAAAEGRSAHAPHLGFDTTMVQTLLWASDHNVLTRDEIQLVARVNLSEPTTDLPRLERDHYYDVLPRLEHMAALAEEMGISYRCIVVRHSRAVAKLGRAVATRMDSPTEL